jgi:hypothetical protein
VANVLNSIHVFPVYGADGSVSKSTSPVPHFAAVVPDLHCSMIGLAAEWGEWNSKPSVGCLGSIVSTSVVDGPNMSRDISMLRMLQSWYPSVGS